MKQPKLILTGMMAAMIASGSYAVAQETEVQKMETNQLRLEEVQALLEQLSQAGALEADKKGNIRVKPSIMDQLRQSGRTESALSAYSVVCD